MLTPSTHHPSTRMQQSLTSWGGADCSIQVFDLTSSFLPNLHSSGHQQRTRPALFPLPDSLSTLPQTSVGLQGYLLTSSQSIRLTPNFPQFSFFNILTRISCFQGIFSLYCATTSPFTGRLGEFGNGSGGRDHASKQDTQEHTATDTAMDQETAASLWLYQSVISC